MEKILIIGQAPGIRKQKVPYDTTLLYEMFNWAGVSKDLAQSLFDFEALTDSFPGKYGKGHAKPSKEAMDKYWENVLESKIQGSNKVILLGNAAKEYFHSKPKTWSCNLQILELIHPSRRNYSKIMNQKESITQSLNLFLND